MAEASSGVPVIIALGANVGDPAAQLDAAVAALRDLVDVDRVSPIYRTAPVGYLDQPDFLNAVLTGRTRATVFELRRRMQRIEDDFGRERGIANGPRTIDLDLLAFGPLVWTSADLVLPHPRMHERTFVLVPLADVAPAWRHPRLGLNAAEMLARLGDTAEIERFRDGHDG